jgi:hypothetical protein
MCSRLLSVCGNLLIHLLKISIATNLVFGDAMRHLSFVHICAECISIGPDMIQVRVSGP